MIESKQTLLLQPEIPQALGIELDTDLRYPEEIGEISTSFMKKLRSIMLHVSNPWVFLKILRKEFAFSHIVRINLRNGKVLEIDSWDELWYCFNAIYFADTIMGKETVPDAVITLIDTRRSILRSISEKWGDDYTGLGGWPRTKEILLYCLISRFAPKAVTETGVAQGVTSRFILEAMKLNGRGSLTSIDLSNYDVSGKMNEDGSIEGVFVREGTGVGWLVTESLKERWNLILGDSREILPNLEITPEIFFHDSDHSYIHMMFEFEEALKKLPKYGLIISDDVKRNSSFKDFLNKYHDSFKEVFFDYGVGILQKIV